MKSHLRFISLFSIAVILAISAIGIQPPQTAYAVVNIIYVDKDANGTFDGTSWTNAYKILQNALAAASSGDQIWVAEGAYYPDAGQNQINNSRAEAFQLINGVAIYGGFDGTETLLSQRDPAANHTILSGDIEQNDTNTDGNNIAESVTDIQGSNSYNVVSSISPVVDSSAVLDGFVITAGKADGSPLQSTTVGGGVRLKSGNSPTLANLTISGNHALASGGGMFNGDNSNPTLTTVTFIGNTANNGGGMDNQNSDPSLTNVTFDGNSATYGGGMNNETGSSPVLKNVIFNGNSADINGGGGGMTVSSDSAPSLTNVTFSDNSAGAGGGMYMIALSNPYLTNVTFNGNSASHDGGGIYMAGSVSGPAYITVRNSTFSNNAANDHGGGVYSSLGDVELRNVTFSGNSAGIAGGGIYNTNTTGVHLINTLIGNSSGGDCVNVGGSGGSALNSLIENSSNACGYTNGVNGNVIGLDPKLGPLQNNGGLTETHALLIGSPAIHAGDDASCLNTDQRGIPRPQGAHCDIGSYEASVPLAFRSNGTYDGWVLESTETSNVGGTMNTTSDLLYVGDNAQDKQYRSILSFNTTGLPDNAVITSVWLKFNVQGFVGGNMFTPTKTLGNLLLDIRNPYFGANANLAVADFQSVASMNAVGALGSIPATGWRTVILKSTAHPFVNLAGITQFSLRFQKDDNDDLSTDYLKIFSGNAPAASRPQLIVEYYVP